MSSSFVYLTSFSGFDCRIGFSSGSFTFSFRDCLDFMVVSSDLNFSIIEDSFIVFFDCASFTFSVSELSKLEAFLQQVNLIKVAA